MLNPQTIDQTPMLSIQNLHKWFGELHVLQGLNLEVEQSEVVCIVGPSGSGKSTLLRCINFLEKPDSGQIFVAGQQMGCGVDCKRGFWRSESTLNLMRAQVGLVFQDFNLWPHMTALQNIVEAPIHVKGMPSSSARELAFKLLDRVSLLDKKDAYPSQLSGGQKQRVAIARALAMEPKIMLFDEPTSALDIELIGEVLKVMKSLVQEGMTMVVVTHELRFAAEAADRVIFMDHGLIVEQAPPHKLFHEPTTERAQRFFAQVLGHTLWP